MLCRISHQYFEIMIMWHVKFLRISFNLISTLCSVITSSLDNYRSHIYSFICLFKSFFLSFLNYFTTYILSANASSCIILDNYILSCIIIWPTLHFYLYSAFMQLISLSLVLIYFLKFMHILVDHHRVTTAKDFNSSYEDSSNDEDSRKPWTALQ